MAGNRKTVDFESALAQLEELVEALEAGDLSLEESLKAFEKGVKLTRQCQTALDKAEQTVQKLVESDNGLKTEPFDESE